MSLHFLSPERLGLLAVVAGLIGAYLWFQTRRAAYAVKFTNIDLLDRVAPRRPRWRRHVPAALFLASMITLVVGFAQPMYEQRIPKERATIILAIDTSISMNATDVDPSRIEAAKTAAISFIDIIPPKINVGVVVFNGSASVKVFPTTDHNALKAGIETIQLNKQTAIGDAIDLSIDTINAIPSDGGETAPPARIVLMSDGKSTIGIPNDVAVQKAVDAGVPISTIGFGTDEGVVSVPDNPTAQIPVPVDRESLEQIAQTGGGQYYSAFTGEELASVYEDIGSSIGYTTQEADAAAYFIGGALVLMMLTSGVSLLWFSRLP